MISTSYSPASTCPREEKKNVAYQGPRVKLARNECSEMMDCRGGLSAEKEERKKKKMPN